MGRFSRLTLFFPSRLTYMKNKQKSLIEKRNNFVCFLGFSVLVSRILVHILNRKSHWSSECDLNFCQVLQLEAREDEERKRSPHASANDIFLKSNLSYAAVFGEAPWLASCNDVKLTIDFKKHYADGACMGLSYLILSCWGLFGLCFVLSDKPSGTEFQRELHRMSSALKSLNISKYPYSLCIIKKKITQNAFIYFFHG